jgi:hypothetical protein
MTVLAFMSKFLSRKLLVTVASVSLVVFAELRGTPLSLESLQAVMAITAASLGSFTAVDSATVWKAGTAIASLAAPSPEPTPPGDPNGEPA